MTQHPRLAEILELPPEERLALAAAIWDSLASTPELVPIPDWHRELVADRIDEDESDPASVESWDVVRQRIEARK